VSLRVHENTGSTRGDLGGSPTVCSSPPPCLLSLALTDGAPRPYQSPSLSACRYHYLNAMIHSTSVMLERAVKEAAGRNKIGEMGQSYEELYKSRIQAEENQSKILRERQKQVKDDHDNNVEQAKMFKSLHKLLACKIRTLQQDVANEGETMLGLGGGSNVMVMD